jgi:hypothetical protein
MGIAEQMGKTLQRTSVSTNIKERLDFSCALFGVFTFSLLPLYINYIAAGWRIGGKRPSPASALGSHARSCSLANTTLGLKIIRNVVFISLTKIQETIGRRATC